MFWWNYCIELPINIAFRRHISFISATGLYHEAYLIYYILILHFIILRDLPYDTWISSHWWKDSICQLHTPLEFAVTKVAE